MVLFRKYMVGLAVVVVLGSLSARVRADSQALLGWSGGGYPYSAVGTFGWEFTVTSPVVVTHLGIWDEGRDGLVDLHPLGIWTDTGSLTAAFATVGSGPNDSEWKWVPLSSEVSLDTGTYVISAGYGSASDEPAVGVSSVMTDPRATYIRRRHHSISGMVYPEFTFADAEAGFFGPNFLIKDPTPVPEPALVQLPVMMAFAGAGMWWRRCRGS